MLTESQVKKFQEIYREKFGLEISRKDAYAKGIALMRAMEIVYKPMTKAEHEELQERRKKVNQ